MKAMDRLTPCRFKHIRFIVCVTVLTALVLAACSPKNPFPLAEPGTYDFGTRGGFSNLYVFTDASRDDREVSIMIWYPARLPENAEPSDYNIDAEPDRSGAPYPLILSSAKMGYYFGPHLASHGFVVVGIKGIDTYDPWDENLFNQPLDILFALDQVAAHPLEGLEEMIDAEHAGTMGYSFDGYNSLAVSGARVDPEFYLGQCANPAVPHPTLPEWAVKLYCNPAIHWDEFSADAGPALTESSDGLWQAMTDERIRAVIPMAPEGALLFGERGLAEVDRPILILVGTEDTGCDYTRESVSIFERAGTPDKTLISFIGEDHDMLFSDVPYLKMKHFTAAFFGWHLQGKTEYAGYFTEKFVSKQDGLAWGVYED